MNQVELLQELKRLAESQSGVTTSIGAVSGTSSVITASHCTSTGTSFVIEVMIDENRAWFSSSNTSTLKEYAFLLYWWSQTIDQYNRERKENHVLLEIENFVRGCKLIDVKRIGNILSLVFYVEKKRHVSCVCTLHISDDKTFTMVVKSFGITKGIAPNDYLTTWKLVAEVVDKFQLIGL